ncbi:hypothetical protein [Novacetimonas sp. GS1]|uniref:hypothetical protein n=1 Tax=Novacetimonas sp. GS1 TaxID=3119990 RepID=UPI002FCCED7A
MLWHASSSPFDHNRGSPTPKASAHRHSAISGLARMGQAGFCMIASLGHDGRPKASGSQFHGISPPTPMDTKQMGKALLLAYANAGRKNITQGQARKLKMATHHALILITPPQLLQNTKK